MNKENLKELADDMVWEMAAHDPYMDSEFWYEECEDAIDDDNLELLCDILYIDSVERLEEMYNDFIIPRSNNGN